MSLRISLRVLGRRESSRNFSDSVIKQWDDSSVITQYIYKGKCYSSSSSSSFFFFFFFGCGRQTKIYRKKGKDLRFQTGKLIAYLYIYLYVFMLM